MLPTWFPATWCSNIMLMPALNHGCLQSWIYLFGKILGTDCHNLIMIVPDQLWPIHQRHAESNEELFGSVQSALERVFFPYVKYLAKRLGISLEYVAVVEWCVHSQCKWKAYDKMFTPNLCFLHLLNHYLDCVKTMWWIESIAGLIYKSCLLKIRLITRHLSASRSGTNLIGNRV
jgi:hypothetical protein